MFIKRYNPFDIITYYETLRDMNASLKCIYRFIPVLIILIIFFLVAPDLDAQCPMCKISAESNLKDGGTAGKGLNAGILFMLSMPYLLVGTLAYVWFRNRKDVDSSNE